ncbi:hypothetical protein HDV05_005727 [Chytridiales sp. JEL 0842]|nr:hypothetical protein HDV05_005727 [Chytridiales sp. JEL 0842]
MSATSSSSSSSSSSNAMSPSTFLDGLQEVLKGHNQLPHSAVTSYHPPPYMHSNNSNTPVHVLFSGGTPSKTVGPKTAFKTHTRPAGVAAITTTTPNPTLPTKKPLTLAPKKYGTMPVSRSQPQVPRNKTRSKSAGAADQVHQDTQYWTPPVPSPGNVINTDRPLPPPPTPPKNDVAFSFSPRVPESSASRPRSQSSPQTVLPAELSTETLVVTSSKVINTKGMKESQMRLKELKEQYPPEIQYSTFTSTPTSTPTAATPALMKPKIASPQPANKKVPKFVNTAVVVPGLFEMDYQPGPGRIGTPIPISPASSSDSEPDEQQQHPQQQHRHPAPHIADTKTKNIAHNAPGAKTPPITLTVHPVFGTGAIKKRTTSMMWIHEPKPQPSYIPPPPRSLTPRPSPKNSPNTSPPSLVHTPPPTTPPMNYSRPCTPTPKMKVFINPTTTNIPQSPTTPHSSTSNASSVIDLREELGSLPRPSR